VRGAAASMQVLRPKTAVDCLATYARIPGAVPLAGGTDFMVAWNTGTENGRTILDLSRLREWTLVRRTPRGLRLGALVSHARIQEHPLVRRELKLLAEACGTVGGVQIQNRGTLGGNIANASPAGDTFPALSVYEAIIHVASSRGRRAVPFGEIFAGVKKTTLEPSELIEGIEVPFSRPRPSRQMFRKVGTRAAQAISKIVAAGLLWLKRDNRVVEMRFALGSMAPTVRRLRSVETFLVGKRLTRDVVAEACRRLADDVAPIDDIRSTAEYRVTVAQNLLSAFLEGK
jgi:xanthine dehydrogenase small subunit